jgi:hypothetical protein
MIQTLLAIIFFLLAPLSSARADDQYMLGYAGFAGFQASMWAVKDFGLLKKYGLDGETILVPGTSRQIRLWSATVSSSLTSTLRVTFEPRCAERKSL